MESQSLFLSNTDTIVNKQGKFLFPWSSYFGQETYMFPNSLEYKSLCLPRMVSRGKCRNCSK